MNYTEKEDLQIKERKSHKAYIRWSRQVCMCLKSWNDLSQQIRSKG